MLRDDIRRAFMAEEWPLDLCEAIMITNDRFDPRERTERVVSYLRDLRISYLRDLRNRLGTGRSAAGSPASHALRPAS